MFGKWKVKEENEMVRSKTYRSKKKKLNQTFELQETFLRRLTQMGQS